eukprot:TRINITY_DN1835_c0_g2_i7.p2 TRINITY_DN1835_c0_g2~~TRINITY_DN1835_c0_g2_i7.p2  ORF type:complete len:116 (+),score=23.50 TRINITY_DN1835_c0_g2_i7:286-633(+)
MKFDFKNKEKPYNYGSHLANKLQDVPYEDVLIAPYLNEEFKPDLINKYLNALGHENLRVLAISKTFEKDCGKWQGTKYAQNKLMLRPLDDSRIREHDSSEQQDTRSPSEESIHPA